MAYSVHTDLKVHSRGIMSFVKDASDSKSIRHRINLRISAESEIIGLNDNMSGVLWTLHFLDNSSSIIVERNWKYLFGKKTRHVDVWYFFITDRIEQKEVRIKYRPQRK